MWSPSEHEQCDALDSQGTSQSRRKRERQTASNEKRRQDQEERGKREETKEETAQHVNGCPRPVGPVGENGENGRVEREGSEQAGQTRAERRGQSGEDQDEGGGDEHPDRQIPCWNACRRGRNPAARNEQQRDDQHQEHGSKEDGRRKGEILQSGGDGGESNAGGQQGQRPGDAGGQPGVDQSECGLRYRSGQSPGRRDRREGEAMIERNEERDGGRGEREANQPPTSGPQRRPTRLATPMRIGVTTSFTRTISMSPRNNTLPGPVFEAREERVMPALARVRAPSKEDDSMPQQLTESARRFLEEKRIGVLATINPDGTPQQSPIWYELQGNEIMMNTRRGRRKDRNLRRDPRCSLCVEGEYDWVTIRGTARLIEDPATAQADIRHLAVVNYGPEEAERSMERQFCREPRVTIRLSIEHVTGEGFEE